MSLRTEFRRIGVEEARTVLARSGAIVLDVRDANSFLRGRIGDARLVSMADMSSLVVATPKTTPILIYCYHGNSSQAYARIFRDFGFAEVYSLDGGYEAWSKQSQTASDPDSGEALRQWLVENGFPAGGIDAIAENGTTPLMKASHKAENDIVSLLIAAGTQLGARNLDGNNALWLACLGADLNVIRTLLKAGIDVDNQNDNGATVLMYAASTGKAAVVECLLEAKPDIALETLDGFSALDMAATVECLTLLRQAARRHGRNGVDGKTVEIARPQA